MLVVGDREAQGGLVAVRNRKHGDQGAVQADEFIARLPHLIAQKRFRRIINLITIAALVVLVGCWVYCILAIAAALRHARHTGTSRIRYARSYQHSQTSRGP